MKRILSSFFSLVFMLTLFSPSAFAMETSSISTEEKVMLVDWKVPAFSDADYKVALAFNDGTYAIVKNSATNDLKAAQQQAEAIQIEGGYDPKSVVATIINRHGFIVYAAYGMGKVAKVKDYKVQIEGSATTILYPTETSTNGYTTVNTSYIDDAPILEYGVNRVRILINGYKGWVNREPLGKDVDLLIVPLSQISNPSHYYVNSSSILNHFISYNLSKSTPNADVRYQIGKAPSFFSVGKTYYSYDGHYFYTDLKNVILDAKEDKKVRAINQEPFYNYYQYLPLTSKTPYNAEQLNTQIRERVTKEVIVGGIKGVPCEQSVLCDRAQDFIDAQNKYGVNALLLLSIAINETNFGTSNQAKQYNIFNINAVDGKPSSGNTYSDVKNAIEDFVTRIGSLYWNVSGTYYNGTHFGNKNLGMNVRYATDPFWGEKAAVYAFSFDYRLSNRIIQNLQGVAFNSVGITSGEFKIVDEIGNDLLGGKGRPGTPIILKALNGTSYATLADLYPTQVMGNIESQYVTRIQY